MKDRNQRQNLEIAILEMIVDDEISLPVPPAGDVPFTWKMLSAVVFILCIFDIIIIHSKYFYVFSDVFYFLDFFLRHYYEKSNARRLHSHRPYFSLSTWYLIEVVLSFPYSICFIYYESLPQFQIWQLRNSTTRPFMSLLFKKDFRKEVFRNVKQYFDNKKYMKQLNSLIYPSKQSSRFADLKLLLSTPANRTTLSSFVKSKWTQAISKVKRIRLKWKALPHYLERGRWLSFALFVIRSGLSYSARRDELLRWLHSVLPPPPPHPSIHPTPVSDVTDDNTHSTPLQSPLIGKHHANMNENTKPTFSPVLAAVDSTSSRSVYHEALDGDED